MEYLSSGFYVFLALLGLGFLIFIHELGHYFMARWVGMRVDTFAIGFGRSIYEWERNGVTWKIGWIPFGGYVRMGGMEEENGIAPENNPDGFFGKSPWDRIKVAAAGPIVNLVFAFLFFSLLWAAGGREKSFSDHTHILGWIDQKSELFQAGIRPGDVITSYNDHPFRRANDHLQVPMLSGQKLEIAGYTVDPITGERGSFEKSVATYEHPLAMVDGLKTVGILAPARYVIYDTLPGGKENPLPEASPMRGSGLSYGDRIYWVDGEIVYSPEHLSHILNSGHLLVTVRRDGDSVQVRVPRIQIGELKLDTLHKDELEDWLYAAGMAKSKLSDLSFIPYNLDAYCTVEGPIALIDSDRQQEVFPESALFGTHQQLKVGDRIVAVDGVAVDRSHDLLKRIQDNQVHIIVDRGEEWKRVVSTEQADREFVHFTDQADLEKLVASIGTDYPLESSGRFALLKPVKPKRQFDFVSDPEQRALMKAQLVEQKKQLEMIANPEWRARALKLLEQQQNTLLLGMYNVQDRRVSYNPGPFLLFTDVVHEVYTMLGSLFSGALSPKWVSGPVGIVQVIQKSFGVSFAEALYWLAAISLNLGLLNLLPIPVLDGGYIVMSIWEILSGKRLKPQTVERLIVPFAVMIIGLLIYLLFNDITRIFGLV